MTSIVSADVALDSADPVVGSFTVDGLTYAVKDGNATLVAVSSDLQQVTDSQDADDSRAAPVLAPGQVAIPASVAYDGATYSVTAVGPYAFYLSGATSVELPASIASVDDHAFRSSDVERVEVVSGNPNLASFDGALYSADLSRLLLIPEGRKGSVLLSCETEVVEPSLFSHCSLVEAISVEEGGAAFSSWNGLLYDASGVTLLRVPAGATDITIHDGCTTIAAGALEGCAKLARINAPASVTSISPDVFESIPTITLPAQMAVQDATNPSVASTLVDQVKESTDSAPQLTAMVALSTADDDLPEVDPSSIEVTLPDGADEAPWRAVNLSVALSAGEPPAIGALQQAESYKGYKTALHGNGGTIYCDNTSAAYPQGGGTGAFSAPDVSSWISVQDGNWKIGKMGQVVYDNGNPLEYWWAYAENAEGHRARGWSSTPSGTLLPVGTVVTDYADLYAVYIPATTVLDGNGGTVHADTTNTAASNELVMQGWATQDGPVIYNWIYLTNGYWQVHGDQVTYDHGNPSDHWWAYADDGNGRRAVGWSASPSGAPLPEGTVATDYPRLYAVWSYDVSFDTSSEPGDAGYPGESKPNEAITTGDGQVPIEDPKRPGYVFEGWVIPNGDGTEAIDQDLVYQGDDGKWYVDASKLPDYAGDDGRVQLTARWTSVISVDVPSSVTFYADLVTQGQESREGAAKGAFGQSKVANQSQVDLRVVGLESSAVKTEGSTLGADSILKKADAATPSTSTQKLLSLYPSTKQWTADELQDPDAVGGSKATTAVDFDLDDILLEKSFAVDDFTIAAGDTLNMGYRLNLSETGQQLDYDALSTLSEGQSASIANVSYTFAGDVFLGPTPSGDETDPLYVTVDEAFITANGLDGKAPAGTYGLADIKAAADDIASKVTVQPPAAGATADQVAAYWDTVQQQASQSSYYPLYKALLDAQVMRTTQADIDAKKVTYGSGPYFQLKVSGATGNGHLPLQLIGICQDTKSDGTGKAGLTFQMRDIYAFNNKASTAAGGATFNYTYMNSSGTNSGGWGSAALRSTLRSTFWGYLPAETQAAIVGVDKFQQLYIGQTFNSSPSYLQETTGESIWLPSMYEVFGASLADCNESEALTGVSGYMPFQYMAYQGNASSTTKTKVVKTHNGSVRIWWLRSAGRRYDTSFCHVDPYGGHGMGYAGNIDGAAPCFCL